MAVAPEGLRTWQRTVQLSDRQLAALWKEYRKTGSEDCRGVLLEHYLPLVRANSERLATRLPNEVELDDLISAGIDGLRDAIEMFDHDRGVKFETYCATRIRGAILDALRNGDWVPRLVRARANQLAEGRRQLEARLGRLPNDREMAEHMGLSEAEYDRLMREAHAVSVTSLNRHFSDGDSAREVREIDLVGNVRAENPVAHIHEEDLRRIVTKGLSKNERLILILYYYEEMTMKEIGATLDLSESRVSQMHSAILERLRANLDGRKDDFLEPEA
ncbi:MAG: FliA/WhiG family RNA polymerase sigma factor [Planctomycetes bacterium]|nr:FliA/WhiG family RNA polymerase sigma factor [Planctomycetota bacterium]